MEPEQKAIARVTQVGRGPPITNAVLVPIFLLEIGCQGLAIAQLNRLVGSIKPPGHSSVTLTKTHAVGLLAVVMVVGVLSRVSGPAATLAMSRSIPCRLSPSRKPGFILTRRSSRRSTKAAPCCGGRSARSSCKRKLSAASVPRPATLWSNETGLRLSPYRFWSVRRGASAGSPVAAIPGPYLRPPNVCTLLPRAEVN